MPISDMPLLSMLRTKTLEMPAKKHDNLPL